MMLFLLIDVNIISFALVFVDQLVYVKNNCWTEKNKYNSSKNDAYKKLCMIAPFFVIYNLPISVFNSIIGFAQQQSLEY